MRYKLATWIERRFNWPAKHFKPGKFVNDKVPFNGYY